MNAHSFFRKKEPVVTELPRPPRPRDEETEEVVAKILQTQRDCAGLRDDVATLEAELRFAQERIRMLESLLVECEHKRDFYQHHSSTLVTRLNDIEMLVGAAKREAEDAAFAPRENMPETRGAITAHGVDIDEDAQLQALARKLAPEGGTDAQS